MSSHKHNLIPQVLATEYASYRDEVILGLSAELIKAEQHLSHPIVIYDPMAGTAPLLHLVERQGYTAYFNDLNSLHLHINAAKTLQSYQTFKEIGPIKVLSIICEMAQKLVNFQRTITKEWIEHPVLEELTLIWRKSEEQSASVAVLIKAILLLSIRNFSSFIKTKNPTWLKPGGLRPNISIEQAFQTSIDRLNSFYQFAYGKHSEIKGGRIVFTDYDASRLVPGCKVDIIITSPPFCNRVDWDRLYAPEHFFLESVGFWHTRTEFLGTTAVHQFPEFESELNFVRKRSDYLKGFLDDVKTRQIRNERHSDYYVKYFTRYFAGLFRIFDKAASVLSKDNAGIYYVVQDNVHRGLLIEIGKILADSLSNQGFNVHPLADSSWDMHHMGLQNVSKHYRLITPKQRESIWHALKK